MMDVQRRGLFEAGVGLALLSMAFGALIDKVDAQNIRAPSKIADASSTIANGDPRFPLRAIRDGMTEDTGANGFVGRRGQLGSITFTLDEKYDVTTFHIWNDINVRAEGIENFTLRFFSGGQPMHAQSFSGGRALKPGVKGQQRFPLSKTVKNVDRVILRVDSLLQRPNTYAKRVEVREVAFTGRPSAEVRAEEKADQDAQDNAAEEAEAQARADAIKKAEEEAKEEAEAEALAMAEAAAEQAKFPPLTMRHFELPAFEPNMVLLFSRAASADLQEIAANNGLTIREMTELDQIGLTMVAARIEPGDTVSEAIARLNAAKLIAWTEPNGYFQLLSNEEGGSHVNSRSGGLAMHGLLLDGVTDAPKLGTDATIVLIDSPVDVENSTFDGAQIEQRVVDVADIPSPHGTAIAELLVGTGDFAGVARGARLVSFAAFEEVDGDKTDIGSATFRSTTATLAKALNAASKLRPHVINLSFGSKYESKVLAELLQVIDGQGVCVASAVGNAKDEDVLFPANFQTTLAITAIERSRRRYEYSSIGDEVNIAAWGVGMNAAVPGGRRTVSGTSFATALVSGAMLRMPSCTGARDPQAMRDAVEGDAENLGDRSIFGAGLFRLGTKTLAEMEESDAPPPAIELPEIEEATDPLWYAAGGVGAAGGGLLFFLAWRRKKKQAQSAAG